MGQGPGSSRPVCHSLSPVRCSVSERSRESLCFGKGILFVPVVSTERPEAATWFREEG